MNPYSPTRGRGTWRITVTLLLLCYVCAMLGPLSWLIPLLLAWGFFITVFRRCWLPGIVLAMANPLSAFWIYGAADYAKGAPTLRGMGLPSTEFSNVDPETRCFQTSGGCLIRGNEWVFLEPHNHALRTLCSIFGPPSRSYDGPYPNKQEASRLASTGSYFDLPDFLDGRIQVGSESLQFDQSLLDTLLTDLFYFPISKYDSEAHGTRIQAVIYRERCLILRFLNHEATEEECIILFDRKNMRPFAYYQIKGSALRRYPRVQYLAERSR